MKRFWISWWTDDYVDAIDRATFDFWISGERPVGDWDKTEFSICAVIDAKNEKSAWRKAQRYFYVKEIRFCDEKRTTYTPVGDRFSLSGTLLRTGRKGQ